MNFIRNVCFATCHFERGEAESRNLIVSTSVEMAASGRVIAAEVEQPVHRKKVRDVSVRAGLAYSLDMTKGGQQASNQNVQVISQPEYHDEYLYSWSLLSLRAEPGNLTFRKELESLDSTRHDKVRGRVIPSGVEESLIISLRPNELSQ